MFKVIKSLEDANKFLGKMPYGMVVGIRDYDVMINTGKDGAYTELTKVDDAHFTIFSCWEGGRDIRPSWLTREEAARWVYKHRQEINGLVKVLNAAEMDERIRESHIMKGQEVKG